MATIRPLLLAAALPLTLVACGGDDGGGTVIPEGEHHQYVASQAFIPTNNNQARDFGLDIDSNNDNGKAVDNRLGEVLGTLSSVAPGFDIQGTVDLAVAEGNIILLLDVQTADFTSTAAAGLRVLLGDNPMPAPCDDPANPTVATCGKHLTGTGSFSIAAGSPTNAAVAGPIVNGTFSGGPGAISLQIALGGSDAIQLDLIGARAKATGITADAVSEVILAGALTEDDLNMDVIPAIQSQLTESIAEDCTMLTMPPDCGCMPGSTAVTILDLFDGGIQGTQKDCAVSVEEIKENSFIKSLLDPDVEIDGVPGLSLGIKVAATKATYPAP